MTVLDAHDFGGDDLAGAHVVLLERLLEQRGKAVRGVRTVGDVV
jgi:hypothetical protein